jgi:uncharacterized membrane protein
LPSLTVWRYPTPFGVDAGEVRLRRLQEQDALTVLDAVVVIWLPEAEKPTVRRLKHDTAKAAAKGSALGALVGLVVLGPVAGAAAGAAAGAVRHRLKGLGIDDELVERMRGELVPGTSALLLLSTDADIEKIRPLLARREATLIHAELGPGVADQLRDLLGEPPP